LKPRTTDTDSYKKQLFNFTTEIEERNDPAKNRKIRFNDEQGKQQQPDSLPFYPRSIYYDGDENRTDVLDEFGIQDVDQVCQRYEKIIENIRHYKSIEYQSRDTAKQQKRKKQRCEKDKDKARS
jgi:hypothetical protein